jgi:hypothetical protein
MSKTTNNVQNILTSYGAFDCADLKQRLSGCNGWTDLRKESTAVLHHRYPSSIANPYLSSCGHIHLSPTETVNYGSTLRPQDGAPAAKAKKTALNYPLRFAKLHRRQVLKP